MKKLLLIVGFFLFFINASSNVFADVNFSKVDRPSLFGINLLEKLQNEFNPTTQNFDKGISEELDILKKNKNIKIKPKERWQEIDYYFARATSVTNIIFGVKGTTPDLTSKRFLPSYFFPLLQFHN